MPEEVLEDHHPQSVHARELLVHELPRRRGRVVDLLQLFQGGHNGGQDARDLSVLIDEDQGVGNITITEMHDTQPNPAANLALHLVQDRLHDAGDARRGLHAVQALAGVAEAVPECRVQEVLFGGLPQGKHVPHDLAPEQQALQAEGVLRPVAVGEAGACAAARDLEAPLAIVARIEVGLEESDHLLAGLTVEPLEGKVVADGGDDRLDVLGGHDRVVGLLPTEKLAQVAGALCCTIWQLLCILALELCEGVVLCLHLRGHLRA
mmetsp:Transcript_61396/g.138332  ORF Transcript_61396/g.138332 Transcript_61396/m.138332 type:complete len:264 (-) Transcript_61396:392-1183(-)